MTNINPADLSVARLGQYGVDLVMLNESRRSRMTGKSAQRSCNAEKNPVQ